MLDVLSPWSGRDEGDAARLSWCGEERVGRESDTVTNVGRAGVVAG
jgi:hypothetical protein